MQPFISPIFLIRLMLWTGVLGSIGCIGLIGLMATNNLPKHKP